jgi:hypothetical protein
MDLHAEPNEQASMMLLVADPATWQGSKSGEEAL